MGSVKQVQMDCQAQIAGIATNGGMPQMHGVGVEEPLSPSQAVIRAQQRSLKRTLEIEIAK